LQPADSLDGRAELVPQADVRGRVASQLVEPEQGGAHDRRRPRPAHLDARRDLLETAFDAAQQAPIRGLEKSAAEQHLRRLALEPEPFERDACERDDLARQALDDLAGDLVVRSFREDDRRELGDPPQVDAISVDRLRELMGSREAEVLGNRALERGARTAPVLASRRSAERGQADVEASAPVTGDRAERRKAGVAPVGRDADAVDPGAAHDGHSPAAFRPRPEHGKSVVADAVPARPAAALDGVAPWVQLRAMSLVWLVDAALSSVGLAVAFASVEDPYGFLLSVPLVILLSVFARERRLHIDHALELSAAYRGTAFLLGDVVEADDAYTGSHSREVVDLAMAVADELGLGAKERRDAEFVALLHDVGKVRIPNSIINKPGPLTDEERAIMNMHTIEGERMLDKVGGLLGEVGSVIRSCHERWDGAGYPDGLAGEEIPLVARVVACCDAYNAMTTDRAYRAALPLEEARAELERNAGSQFDPAVVAALIRVLETREPPPAPL
jgi:HD-GYP domain-containing protein (c-di-GMP phosphodiesterase class II)